MGYDCTLHVIDERAIRERFVPALLGRPTEPSRFDERPDASGLWDEVRAALNGELYPGEDDEVDQEIGPEATANFVGQLAIAFCASELPYQYERGFCASLWPSLRGILSNSVPGEFLGDPEALFAEVVAAYPALAGQFPRLIEGNYCTGLYTPAERVPALLAWVEEEVGNYPKPDRNQFRGLILVLREAAARGLGYWEGAEMPVPWRSTVESREGRHRGRLESCPAPPGMYLDCVGRAGDTVAFAHKTGFPRDCRTAFADFSAWPPTFAISEEYCLSAARSPLGRWATASMTPDRAYLYRVRVGDSPQGTKELLLPPDERENGVKWADFLGERIIAALDSKVIYPAKTLLPAIPLIEHDGRLVPIEELPPGRGQFTIAGTARLGDGGVVFIWDGDGYEPRLGRLECTFPIGAMGNSLGLWPTFPSDPDGFFYLSSRRLHSARRGQPPVRHLPEVENVMHIGPGPDGAVLLKQGENDLGDLGKLYFPGVGDLIRIEPELFEDADPASITTLIWAGPVGRLVAATASHFWAVPSSAIWTLPRHRSGPAREVSGGSSPGRA